MDAKELSALFSEKVVSARMERDRQTTAVNDDADLRRDELEHCKRAMSENVLPFLAELKSHFPDGQFMFARQID